MSKIFGKHNFLAGKKFQPFRLPHQENLSRCCSWLQTTVTRWASSTIPQRWKARNNFWTLLAVPRPITHNCVTQLMLYTGDKLSSTIFWCLSVCEASVSPDQISTFFQYIQAYKPFADHVPPNSKQYQLILTKYQPASSYTDPVPSSTTYNSSYRKAQFSQLNNLSFYDSFDESRRVYLV